jgi:hypothetical protein
MTPEERKRLNEILLRYKEGVPLEEKIVDVNFIEATRLLYNAVKENELSYGEFVYLLNKVKK